MKSKIATILLWVVTIIWGFGFVLSDIALSELSSLQFMVIRFFIASIVLALIINKRIFTITKYELKYGTLLGVILFLCFYLQTVGLEHTSLSKNAFLTAIYVVFVPLFAFLFNKNKLSLIKCLSAILAIIGSGVMSLTSELSFNLGDTLSLLGSVAFALQIYFTGIFVKKIRTDILVFVEIFVTFILSLIFVLPMEGIMIPTNKYVIFSLIGSGVLPTSLCYFLQTWAQQYTNETTSAIILSLEAVFGMLASYLILNEHITLRMLIGAGIILLAVFMAEIDFNKLFRKNKLTN